MTHDAARQLLDDYARAWSANDPEQIGSLWDADDPSVFYKAEEVLHYFHSMDEIMHYWSSNQRFHETVRLSFSNLKLKAIAENRAILFLNMRWDIRFAANAVHDNGAPFASAGKAMGGQNHVLAMVRQTDAGLKLTGWSETPDAPITYMRQLYEWNAASDL